MASLARPGGNITGISTIIAELAAKRVELLKATVPAITRVGILWYPSGGSMDLTFSETEKAAHLLGLELQPLPVREPADLGGAFEAAIKGHVEALIIVQQTVLSAHRSQIIEFAADHHLPAIYSLRGWVEASGLFSYSANGREAWRRVAYYVNRILSGAKPADLPVEQPMTFDFVVNMKTARELGITFPPEILLQVTEVIQ